MRPELILFDYGQTLLHEQEFDALRGEVALFEFVKSNPRRITPREANDFAQAVFADTRAGRALGLEMHEWQMLRLIYETLQIEFSIPFHEIEHVFWDNASPGGLMPGVLEMLNSVKEMNIRCGVVSNLGFSGAALTRRINMFIPNNHFEFIITSSEYGFCKPSHYLFELALAKAGVDASAAWFCGDNPVADVEGAAAVGIRPIWYDCDEIKNNWRSNEFKPPECPHTRITNWRQLTQLLVTA